MKKVLSRLTRVGRSASRASEPAPAPDGAALIPSGGPASDDRPAAYDLGQGRPLTGLQKAVWECDLTRFRAITDKSAVGVLARDAEGRSLLHLAAARGHYQLVELLVDKGLPLEGQDRQGCTPLIKAVEADSAAAVLLLLKHGADANHRNLQGACALHISVVRGTDLVLQTLLQHGADVNIVNQDGCTPLHLAVLHGHSDAVDLLLLHGASPAPLDSAGRSALHVAVAAGHRELVKRLLNAGADPTATDAQGVTPGDLAAAEGFPSLQVVIERASLKQTKQEQTHGSSSPPQKPTTPKAGVVQQAVAVRAGSPGLPSPIARVASHPPQPVDAPPTLARDVTTAAGHDSDSWSDDDELDFAPAARKPARPLPSCLSSSPPRGAGGDATNDVTTDDVTSVHVSGVRRLSSAESATRRNEQKEKEQGGRDVDSAQRLGRMESWDGISPVSRKSWQGSWGDSESEKEGEKGVSLAKDDRERGMKSEGDEKLALSRPGGAGDRNSPVIRESPDIDDSWGDVSPIPTPRDAGSVGIASQKIVKTKDNLSTGDAKGDEDTDSSWGDGSPAMPRSSSGVRSALRNNKRRSSEVLDSHENGSVEKMRGVVDDGNPDGSVLDGEDSWGDLSPIMRRVTDSKQAGNADLSDEASNQLCSGSKTNLYFEDERHALNEEHPTGEEDSGSPKVASTGVQSPSKQSLSFENSWREFSPGMPRSPPKLSHEKSASETVIDAATKPLDNGENDNSWGDGHVFPSLSKKNTVAATDTAKEKASGPDLPVNPPGRRNSEEEDSWGDNVLAQDQPKNPGVTRQHPEKTSDIHDLVIEKLSSALHEKTAFTPRSDGKTDSESVNFSDYDDILDDLDSRRHQKNENTSVSLSVPHKLHSPEDDKMSVEPIDFRNGRSELNALQSSQQKWPKVSLSDEVTDSAFSTGPRSSRSSQDAEKVLENDMRSDRMTAEAELEERDADSWSDSVSGPGQSRTCLPTVDKCIEETAVGNVESIMLANVDASDSRGPSKGKEAESTMVKEDKSEEESISVKSLLGQLTRDDSWGDNESSDVSPKKREVSQLGNGNVLTDQDVCTNSSLKSRMSSTQPVPSPQSNSVTNVKSPHTMDVNLTKFPASRRPSVTSVTITEPTFQQTAPSRPPISRVNSWCEDESSSSAPPHTISPLKKQHQDEPLQEEDVSQSSWDSSSAADNGETSAGLGSPSAVRAAVEEAAAREESSWGDSSYADGARDSPTHRDRVSSGEDRDERKMLEELGDMHPHVDEDLTGRHREEEREGTGLDGGQSPTRPSSRNIQFQSDELPSDGPAQDGQSTRRQLQRTGSLVGTLGREGTLLGCDELWAGNDTVSPPTTERRRRRRALRRNRRRVSVDLHDLALSDTEPYGSPPFRSRRSSSASVRSLGRRPGLLARTGRKLQTLKQAVLAPLRTMRRGSHPTELSPHELPHHRRQSFVSIDSFLSERGMMDQVLPEELAADDELEDMYQAAADVSLQLGDGHITSAQLIMSPKQPLDSAEDQLKWLEDGNMENDSLSSGHDLHSLPPERPPRGRLRRSRSVDAAQLPASVAEWRHLRVSVTSLADIAEEDGAAEAKRRRWSVAGEHRAEQGKTVDEGQEAGMSVGRRNGTWIEEERHRRSDILSATANDDVLGSPPGRGLDINVSNGVADSQQRRASVSEVYTALTHERSTHEKLRNLYQRLQTELAEERAARQNVHHQLTQSAAEAEQLRDTVKQQAEKLTEMQLAAEASEAASAHAREELRQLTADSEARVSLARAEMEVKIAAVRTDAEVEYSERQKQREQEVKEEVHTRVEEAKRETEKMCEEEAERRMNEVNAVAEKKIKALRVEVEAACRERHEADVTALRSEMDSQVAAVRLELEEERGKVTETNHDDVEAKLVTLRTELESEHRKQNDMVRNAVEKLKATERAALVAEHQKELASREAEFETKLQEVREDMEKAWQAKLEFRISDATAVESTIEDARNECEEKLVEMEENQTNMRKNMEEELREKLEKQLVDIAGETSQLRHQIQDYEKQIASLTSEAELQHAAVRTQVEEEFKAKYEGISLESQERTDALRKEVEENFKKKHELELSALRAEHVAHVEALRSEMEVDHQKRTEECIAEVRRDVNTQISATLEKAEATLSEMKGNIEEEYRQKAASEVARHQEEAAAKATAVELKLEEEHKAELAKREAQLTGEIDRIREEYEKELNDLKRGCSEAEAKTRRDAEAHLAEVEERAAERASALLEELESYKQMQESAREMQEQTENTANEVSRITSEYECQLAEIRGDLLKVQTICEEEKKAAEQERLRHAGQLADRETSLARLRAQHQALSRQLTDLTSDLASARADHAATEETLALASAERDSWRKRCCEAESELSVARSAAPVPLQRRSSAVQTDWPDAPTSSSPSPSPLPVLRLTVPQQDDFYGANSPRPGTASPRPSWEQEGRHPVEHGSDDDDVDRRGVLEWEETPRKYLEKGCGRGGGLSSGGVGAIFNKQQRASVEGGCSFDREYVEAVCTPRCELGGHVDDRPFSVIGNGRALTEIATQTRDNDCQDQVTGVVGTQFLDERRLRENMQHQGELRAKDEETERLRKDLAESCNLIEELTRTVHASRGCQDSNRQLQEDLNTLIEREKQATERQLQCSSELLKIRLELSESRASNDRLESVLAATNLQETRLQAKVKELTFNLARAELKNQVGGAPADNVELQARSPSYNLAELLTNHKQDDAAPAQQMSPAARLCAELNNNNREKSPEHGVASASEHGTNVGPCGVEQVCSRTSHVQPERATRAASHEEVASRPSRVPSEDAIRSRNGAVTKRRGASSGDRPGERCVRRQVFPEEPPPTEDSVFPSWAVPVALHTDTVALNESDLPQLEDFTTSEACSDDASAAAAPPPITASRQRSRSHALAFATPHHHDSAALAAASSRLASIERAYVETSRRLAAETAHSQQLERHAASLKTKYRLSRQQQQQEAAAADQQRMIREQLTGLQETVAAERQQRALLHLELERLRGSHQQEKVMAELRRHDGDTSGRLTETDVRRIIEEQVSRLSGAVLPADAQKEETFLRQCQQIQLMSTPVSGRQVAPPSDQTFITPRAMPLLPELRVPAVLPDFRAMACSAERAPSAGGRPPVPAAAVTPSEALSRRLRRELERSMRRHLADEDVTRPWSTANGSVGSVGSTTSRTSSTAHAPDDPVDRSQRECLATVVSLYSL